LYDHIAGELVSKDLTHAVVRAAGVGYLLSIPMSTYEALPPSGQVLLFTYLAVSENSLRLFGFATHSERELFRILIAAKGIGPSTALAIMSGSSVDNLTRAVASEDYESLEMIRGIGAKTARRLVAEIKDDIVEFRDRFLAGAPKTTAGDRDAALALVSLGFPRHSAERAVEKARAENPSAGVEELVRIVLRSSAG